MKLVSTQIENVLPYRISLTVLPFNEDGAGATSLIFMPFLGGSQREWSETVGLLSVAFHCITVDLPGFGDAAAVPGYSVREMTGALTELLSSLSLSRYILVGHSMAGKLSAVVTRQLIDARLPIEPPAALILVAPSPPGPEPMTATKRSEMLKSLGNQAQLRLGNYSEEDQPAAEQFVRDNIAHPIADALFLRTVQDVLKMNPAAWTAWLESGSKEDWEAFVGIIKLPTLIVAGTDDQALGPDAQRIHTVPHFPFGQLAEVECGHLIPLEKPDELASLISDFVDHADLGVHA